MNLTESPPAPVYYSSDITRTIEAALAAADAKARMAEHILSRRVQARANVLAAESRFLETLADVDLNLFAAAKMELSHHELAASSIADAGGPDGAKHRTIHTREIFELLAAGLTERIELLGKAMPRAMKALADARHGATVAGMHTILIENLPEIQRLRLIGENVINDRNNAISLRDWCGRWTPGNRDQAQTFGSIYGGLTAPLPN